MKPQFRVLLFLAALAPLSSSLPAFAQTPAYSVTVDGKPLAFGDAPPRNVEGRVLVPLRAIFEALGAQVSFSNGVISASRGQTSLQLTIGSNQALIGSEVKTLEVPPQILDGKTFVPLRFVGEALGAGVSFSGATGQIALSSPKTGGETGEGPALPAAQTLNGVVLRVDSGNPARVIVSTSGQLKSYEIAPGALFLRQLSVAPSLSATPVKGAARPTTLASIGAGSDVRLTLDANNRVIQILQTATVVLAKVQFAAGNQIILDDERDTTLTVGETLPFTNAQNQTSEVVNLAPGATIALFLSRETKAVYRISAAPADIALTNNTTGTPNPLPVTPPQNAPQITLVQTDAKAPLKAGARLTVSARATSGQNLSLSLGSKIQNVTLVESATEAGTYSATYTVKAGDDVLEAKPTVRLSGVGGVETTKQTENAVTIDTQAPKLVGTFPANGARLNIAQPNIVIFADDLGGSGLSRAKITLTTATGAVVEAPATVAPPTQVNAVAPQGLAGLVKVSAQIFDRAGNALPVNFSFTVGAAQTGAIQSFAQGATRALVPGEEVPLELRAAPGGDATFDVRGPNGALIAQNLTMIEDGNTPGRYRATYRVPDGATGPLRFTGKFNAGDGILAQSEASAPVQIAAVAAPAKLTVTAPKDGDVATSPLVLRGKAAPGAQVEIAITASGTQLFIFEYNEDLGKFQTRADAQGNWQSEEIKLPARKNIGGLTYSISVTQTDAVNRESTPVTLTLRGR